MYDLVPGTMAWYLYSAVACAVWPVCAPQVRCGRAVYRTQLYYTIETNGTRVLLLGRRWAVTGGAWAVGP